MATLSSQSNTQTSGGAEASLRPTAQVLAFRLFFPCAYSITTTTGHNLKHSIVYCSSQQLVCQTAR